MDLKNKTILCLGDSITEANTYLETLKEISVAKAVINYGVGGTTIAKRKTLLGNAYDQDFIMRVDAMQTEADIVLVFGGTNDYGHGDVPIGLETDNSTETFSGSVRVLINKLKGKYPQTKIFFITPLHRVGEDNPHGEFGKKPTPMGTLNDYVIALKKVIEKESLPILDFYNDGDFSLSNELFKSYVALDGLHPNNDGHKAIARKINDFCKTL